MLRVGRLIASVCIAVTLVLVTPPAFARPSRLVFGPGHEQELLRLALPYQLGGPVSGGYTFGGLRIERDRLEFVVWSPSRVTVSTVTVRPDGSGYSFSTVPPPEGLAPDARAAVEALERVVRDNTSRTVLPRERPRSTTPPGMVRDRLRPVVVAIGIWALLLLIRFRARVRRNKGLRDVEPSLPSRRGLRAVVAWWLPLAATAVTAAGAGWLDARRMGQRDWSDMPLAKTALAVAAAVVVAAAVGGIPALRRHVRRNGEFLRALAIDSIALFIVAFGVRHGLTHANVLTDGGTAWARVRGSNAGYAGMAALFMQLPSARSTSLLAAYAGFLRDFNALIAPALALLARGLGLSRRASVIAGLSIACWPLHAAMFSSDFELGGALTLAVLGFGTLAIGLRLRSRWLIATSLALFTWDIWCRPEAPIVLLAAAALVWRKPVRVVRSAEVLIAGAALAYSLGLRLAHMPSSQGSQWSLAGFASAPWWRFVSDQRLLPWFVWLPAAFGLRHLGRSRALVIAAGFVPGAFIATRLTIDATDTWQELFRYGSWCWPWLVVASAAGFEAGYDSLQRRRPQFAYGAAGLLLLWIGSAPLRAREYLSRVYRPTQELASFAQALRRVPGECTLIVPDDDTASGAARGTGIEVKAEFVEPALASENPPVIAGVSDVLGEIARGESIDSCAYFFEGHYCHDGVSNTRTDICDRLRHALPMHVIERWPGQTYHHRLVTHPRLETAPFYDPHRATVLYRIDARP